jgi:hypothetical protein
MGDENPLLMVCSYAEIVGDGYAEIIGRDAPVGRRSISV